MENNRNGMSRVRQALMALATAGGLAMTAAPAQALDFYMGAGIGQSNAGLNANDLAIPEFDKTDMGWKLFAGLKVTMFGAELDYINFGKPSGTDTEVRYKGLAGYGLFYLPLPVPFLDIYAKAGLARVDADFEIDTDSFSTDDTKFAYGAGVQLKFGALAVRGEYEKFKVEGAKPSLLSLSAAYSF